MKLTFLALLFFTLLPATMFTDVDSAQTNRQKAETLLKRAQILHFKKQYKEMHKLLVEALDTYNQDPIFAESVYGFAASYYSQTPEDFYPEASDYNFTIGKVFEDDQPPYFEFKGNGYCDKDNPFIKVEVETPDKEKFLVYEPGSADSSLYPRENNKQLVLLAVSKKKSPFLPTGVYRWSVTLKDGTTQIFPIILKPDNDTITPKIDLFEEKVKLTFLKTQSKKEDHQNMGWYMEVSPPKTQPTLSTYLTEAGATPFEITLERPKAQQGRRITLLHYEILSLKGAPGIGYVFERIINVQ